MTVLAPQSIVGLGEHETIWIDKWDDVEIIVIDEILCDVVTAVIPSH